MRALRYVGAAVSVVVGAYLLLMANGIRMHMQARAQGWDFYVPSHPVARIVVYAAVAIALQFISAWLLMPAAVLPSATDARSGRFWAGYATRVIVVLGAVVLAAMIMFFLAMALADAGVI